MRFILDTNICIRMMKEGSFSLLKNAKRKSSTSISISSVTEAELWYGVWKSKRTEENKQRLEIFLSAFEKLEFDSSHAELYGILKVEQRNKGKVIGNNDLMIAAQAMNLDAVLVTDNEKEFKQIKDLRTENWLRATP